MIIFQHRIYRIDLRNNPDVLYVSGLYRGPDDREAVDDLGGTAVPVARSLKAEGSSMTVDIYHPDRMEALARPPKHADDLAVDRFFAAMKAKLAKKRAEGRGGWENKEECSAEYLSRLLREHVEKGDPIDVANFCMMLHQRGERIMHSAPSFKAKAEGEIHSPPGRSAPSNGALHGSAGLPKEQGSET